MLYSFKKLKSFLDRLGIIKAESKNQIEFSRKIINLGAAIDKGEITFTENDEIEINIDGKKHKGYLYMPDYDVARYNTFPRMHTHNCDTLKERHKYKGYYILSNASKNVVIERSTKERYENVVLDQCYNCKKMARAEMRVENSEGFAKLFVKTSEGDVDINGYHKNWRKISRAYREEVDYTCESCGVKPKISLNQFYWHTHHINGDKLDNRKENLSCLCILCHANVDDLHRENFSIGNNLEKVEYFKKMLKAELKANKNPYL